MNETTSAEHLSCLMDGELDAKGSRFLIRRLSGDAGLQATWRRYHIVRACLHKEAPSAVDLSARVARALESEAAVMRPVGSRWFRPLAGGAIAAAVAAVAVVGLIRQQPAVDQPFSDTQVAETTEFRSRPSPLDRYFTETPQPVSYSQSDDDQRAARARINAYVVRHNQMAVGAGTAGFAPYISIVTERPVAETADRRSAAETSETTADQE